MRFRRRRGSSGVGGSDCLLSRVCHTGGRSGGLRDQPDAAPERRPGPAGKGQEGAFPRRQPACPPGQTHQRRAPAMALVRAAIKVFFGGGGCAKLQQSNPEFVSPPLFTWMGCGIRETDPSRLGPLFRRIARGLFAEPTPPTEHGGSLRVERGRWGC